ncbi:MAG: Gfo/Idh/MocA family oxidoreductase [Balneolaceae bacterium]|nr:Gfo/Idh/MocA family oxidoreductase [Balneolaceae bacterium]MBO6546843.1 Gfo/Idh/MocA family oxidoreductase [Balneolaceae bacterium]MBO6649203.1 Gfo/Idh/MocA family oxidoreductase [Balneolaceae bacterium]
MPDVRKVKWGVLSTANIGVNSVIPSMQKSRLCEIVAISSRNIENARTAAQKLEISKFFGSYEELLADPEIEAIYNPLPNHLHVPWTIKALEAGKHVLCEKPISITAKEAQSLIDATEKYPQLKVMEAFMYRFHPQWEKVKEIIKSGVIGDLRCTNSVFTYHNVDPDNVRNQANIGGGGMLDIGCYCINLSRFLFEREPINIQSFVDYDPVFNTDRLVSGILEFEGGIANFLCSTQLDHRQSATIYGTKGYMELNIPFNSANEVTRKLKLHKGGETETIFFETCDQYILQGDAFSKAILDDTPVPNSLEDSLANMKVIDQILGKNNNG